MTATLKRIEGKRPWDPPGLTLELGGHTGGVESVAFSPDGRYVLSGGGDKTVRLWDAETGEEIHRLVGHQRRISSVAFSADGSLAVSGSYEPMWNEPGDEYSVRIWDLQTGQQLRQIEAYGYVTDVAFSPDGRYILAGGYVLDRDVKRYLAQGVPTLRLWNSKTGALAKEFFDRSVVLQVAFLPDERYVLSAFNRSTTHQPLCISDTQTGLRIRCFGGRRTQIQSMCVSPDSRRLLTASQDGFIHEWDLETGEEVRRLRVDSLFAWGAVYLPDGRRILTSGADKTIRLWDLETEVEIQRFQGHRNTTKGLAVSPDGRRAVSGSLDGTIRLWKLPE